MTRRACIAPLVALLGMASCNALTDVGALSVAAPSEDGGRTDVRTETPGPGPEDAAVSPDASPTPPPPRAWRQVTSAAPPARHSARMVYDEARQRVVLYGGVAAETMYDETWEWDGTTWARANVTAPPPPKKGFGMAYDPVRRVTMALGTRSESTQPWEWSGGSAWTNNVVGSAAPAGAFALAAAFDTARNVLVVVGGYSTTLDRDVTETWEWSASGGYVMRTPEVPPPGRSAHALVYDVARARVVLFGGNSKTSSNELWEYDGVTWVNRTATEPPGTPWPRERSAPCAAYDASRRTVVVVGGRPDDKTVTFADTWEWDGTTWKLGGAGPPGRRSCAMAYDAARDAIVMYGGTQVSSGGTKQPLGDTWIYE